MKVDGLTAYDPILQKLTTFYLLPKIMGLHSNALTAKVAKDCVSKESEEESLTSLFSGLPFSCNRKPAYLNDV